MHRTILYYIPLGFASLLFVFEYNIQSMYRSVPANLMYTHILYYINALYGFALVDMRTFTNLNRFRSDYNHLLANYLENIIIWTRGCDFKRHTIRKWPKCKCKIMRST